MVPGWFKSELSAGGVKWDVEKTSKGTRLICILAQRSHKALPDVGRLWPSDDDDDVGGDDDDGDDCGDEQDGED